MFRRRNRLFQTRVSRHSRRAFKSILRSRRSDAQWMKRYQERQDRHARYRKAFRFVPLNFSRFKSLVAVFFGLLSQLSNAQPRSIHFNRSGMLGSRGGKRRKKNRRKKSVRNKPASSSYQPLEPRQLLAVDLVSGVQTSFSDTAFGSSFIESQSVSADGRYVAFTSDAADLVPGDTNNQHDVFRLDRQTNEIVLVSVNSGGTGSGNDDSFNPVISADGSTIAFHSDASDLTTDNDNNRTDVFVRVFDEIAGDSTTLVSVNSDNTGSGNSTSFNPVISPDISWAYFGGSNSLRLGFLV